MERKLKDITNIANDVIDFIKEEKDFAEKNGTDFSNLGIAIDKNAIPFAFKSEEKENDIEEGDVILFNPGEVASLLAIEEIFSSFQKISLRKQGYMPLTVLLGSTPKSGTNGNEKSLSLSYRP